MYYLILLSLVFCIMQLDFIYLYKIADMSYSFSQFFWQKGFKLYFSQNYIYYIWQLISLFSHLKTMLFPLAVNVFCDNDNFICILSILPYFPSIGVKSLWHTNNSGVLFTISNIFCHYRKFVPIFTYEWLWHRTSSYKRLSFLPPLKFLMKTHVENIKIDCIIHVFVRQKTNQAWMYYCHK